MARNVSSPDGVPSRLPASRRQPEPARVLPASSARTGDGDGFDASPAGALRAPLPFTKGALAPSIAASPAPPTWPAPFPRCRSAFATPELAAPVGLLLPAGPSACALSEPLAAPSPSPADSAAVASPGRGSAAAAFPPPSMAAMPRELGGQLLAVTGFTATGCGARASLSFPGADSSAGNSDALLAASDWSRPGARVSSGEGARSSAAAVTTAALLVLPGVTFPVTTDAAACSFALAMTLRMASACCLTRGDAPLAAMSRPRLSGGSLASLINTARGIT
mmetsp:Transcript_32438/g.76990  ORF Transcript_32438/g.76990 Transcript_32438/m.76990 type:complete len:279 (+) Transcript_32438:800-1636(+)